MKKAFFIDAQLFQTPNWNRGTGRYAYSLLKSSSHRLNNLYKDYEIIFILSDNLPTEGIWKNSLKLLFPSSSFKKLNLIIPAISANYRESLKENQKTIESFVKLYHCNSKYLVLSLMDDLLYAVFPKSDKISNLLIFYDLIPLIFPLTYFSNRPEYQDNYLSRLSYIFYADYIFTISITTSRDLHLYLQIPTKRLFPILGGAYPMPQPTKPKILYNKPDIHYVLAVLGDDPRKNIIRSCEAFVIFAKKNPTFKLILTSTYSDQTKNIINTIVKNAIFVGNVSDKELSWLYLNTKVVLFTSEYEGLGMPLIEGIQAEVPVVCSDIEIMREIANNTVLYANPYDASDIAASLQKAIMDDSVKYDNKNYKKILKKFSWQASSDMFIDGLNKEQPKQSYKKYLKIAIVGPTSGSICSIGKFIEEQYASWQNYVNIDYYLEDSPSTPRFNNTFLTKAVNTYRIQDFPSRSKYYDHIIYHIGNSDFHLYTARMALSISGIIILHDVYLNGLWHEMEAHNVISVRRYKVEDYLNTEHAKLKDSFLTSLVARSKHVITHSQYANDVIKKTGINKPVTVLNHPIPFYPQQNFDSNHSRFTVGLGGILTQDKGLDIMFNLIKDSRFDCVQFRIFGHKTDYDNGLINLMSKNPRVKISTNITDLEYIMELKNVNILLNFRKHYRGEASRATLEAMRVGVVPIVRNIGWFKELPKNTAIKVDSPQEIPAILLDILNNPKQLIKMKKAIKSYLIKECNIESYINKVMLILQDYK